MDEQEQADRMAAAEALFMISTRGSKSKGESATRRSKRGRKKKNIIDYDDKLDIGIHTDTSEDEVKLKKANKRGQSINDNVTKSSGDSRVGKVRTIGKKFSKDVPNTDDIAQSYQSKMSHPTPKKRYKTKSDNLPSNAGTNIFTTTNKYEIQVEDTSPSFKTNKRPGKGKLSKVGNETSKLDGTAAEEILGFTGMSVAVSNSPPKLASAKQINKAASPRRTPSTHAESLQPQLKSTDSGTSLPSSASLLSMNISTPEVVSLPSLPTGIGSLQLPSNPVPNLSSLSEIKRPEPSVNKREESQKQLPLKKRKLLGAAQVEEEKTAEDVSDGEEEVSSVGQVQATFTVQAHPIITMQTLMEIKTALTPDEDGDLPLHIAVVHENMRMVTKLINLMRIAVKGVDKFNKQQQTPLHLAVKLNFVPAVDLLITSGGNINTVDWTGSSAIHMAVQGGFYQCLELILKRCPHAETNARNFEGLSPLHLAVTNRDMKQVQLLLKFGADIDLPDGKSGRTALFHAAETNQKNLVELLLKQGANPDLTNYAGVTATMAAQGRNLHSILKLIGSVVQDKQDNKWSTVTVKNQSGSVMMEVNQDDDSVDVAAVGGSTSSLLQQQHPVSNSLLRQMSTDSTSKNSGSIDALDSKGRPYQNLVVISEPPRRHSIEGLRGKGSPLLYPQHTTSSLTPSPKNTVPSAEIKVETELMNSNGAYDSSSLSHHILISSSSTSSSSLPLSSPLPSLSSFPIVSVKQEVKDNSADGIRYTATPSSSLSTLNKLVVVPQSAGVPISLGAIGLSGKPILREMSGKLNTNTNNIGKDDNYSDGNGSKSSSKTKTHSISPITTTTTTGSDMALGNSHRQHRLSPASERRQQQQQELEIGKLSVPRHHPSSVSMSNPSSPRSPARGLPTTTNASSLSPSSSSGPPASNTDTLTLTSNQARLYKRLLEMYNIHPSAPTLSSNTSPNTPISGTGLPPSFTLRSLPILPSASPISSPSRPSSTSNNHSPPPLSSSSSPPPPHSPSSQTTAKSSDKQKQKPNHPDIRSHKPQPFLLQRSISTQDPHSTHRGAIYRSDQQSPPPPQSLTPPQRVSILRVTDSTTTTQPTPNFITLSHDQVYPHPHHHQSYNPSPRPHTNHRVFKYNMPPEIINDPSNVTPTTLTQQLSNTTTISDMPLNLSSKVYPPKTQTRYHSDTTATSSHIIASVNSDDKHALQKKPTMIIQDKRNENDKDTLLVPEFPHITKSVSPKAASFVRNFLSQQKLQQQQHHLLENQIVYSSNNERKKSSSPPPPSPSSSSPPSSSTPSIPCGLQKIQHYPPTLKSINIPPLTKPTSSLLSLAPTHSASSSLPGSPSSVVSTLSLPTSQLDGRYNLTLIKNADIAIKPSTTPTPLTPATATAIITTAPMTISANPRFLHQSGRVIDLSIGDDGGRGGAHHHHQSFTTSHGKSMDASSTPNAMEGKMVGFSGAIIPIPTPSSSMSSSSSSLSSSSHHPGGKSGGPNHKTFSSSDASQKSKQDKNSTSSAISTSMTAATTTSTTTPVVTKEKGKRKGGRKAGGGGGAKSGQATPILPESPAPMQNKINSETDQKLKKFLGKKRSEQGVGISISSSSSSTSSSAVPLSASGNGKTKTDRDGYLEVSSVGKTHSGVENFGNDSGGVGDKDNSSKDGVYNKQESNNSSNSLRLTHGVNEYEPVIETVGIFSGNIQHVRVKSSSLKSLPGLSSSSSTNKTGGNRKLFVSNNSSNNANLPPALTLSSWPQPQSSKQFSSSASSLSSSSPSSSSKHERIPNADNNDMDEKTDSFINDERKGGNQSDDVYYSERIVWRSSPLLSVPSPLPPPPPPEKQEVVGKRASRKSPKLKSADEAAAVVMPANEFLSRKAPVVVRPAVEEVVLSSGSFQSIVHDSVEVDEIVVVEKNGGCDSSSGGVSVRDFRNVDEYKIAYDDARNENNVSVDKRTTSEERKLLADGERVVVGGSSPSNVEMELDRCKDGRLEGGMVVGHRTEVVGIGRRIKTSVNHRIGVSGDGGSSGSGSSSGVGCGDIGSGKFGVKSDDAPSSRTIIGSNVEGGSGGGGGGDCLARVKVSEEGGSSGEDVDNNINNGGEKGERGIINVVEIRDEKSKDGCVIVSRSGDGDDDDKSQRRDGGSGVDSSYRRGGGSDKTGDGHHQRSVSGSSDSVGGDRGSTCHETDVSQRLSVEEERELVIDLGTPTDSKAFVTASAD